MRPALVTILPMLAAAVLVMVGGERMARRDVETRSPADRERLFDLADAFRIELQRLDEIYLGHLDRLARVSLHESRADASAQASAVAGVRLIRIFRQKGKDDEISTTYLPNSRRLPEIELENRKRPLDLNSAVIVKSTLLESELPPEGIWLASSSAGFRVHCRQPEPGVLVAFLIDVPQLRQRSVAHLGTWLDQPLTPIREAEERVAIELVGGPALASVGPARHGPAASIIPARNFSGDWQIRAWDLLSFSRSHDATTLAAASTLALILAGSGWLLFSQQKRALKLAAERVSFVNRVSHELGTPLTNLSLNLDLAREAFSTRPGEARRRLGLVAEEIERLSRLVANVLTFSRRERDSLQLKPVHTVPGEIIRRTLESFRPALERRGIAIEASVTAEAPMMIDPDALSQITGNLLSNVEKYAVSGRWMHLSASMQGEHLVVEVRDRGPGIPQAAKNRVFAPFERVLDTTNEGASGTGLGLFIARDLARRMGGGLELVDSSADGSVFRLRVPATPALVVVSDTHAA